TASLPPAPPAGANAQILALTAAFRALNSALQGLLLMMGATFGGQASAELLSMVGGAPIDNINQAMTLLSHRHLVERLWRYGAPYYRLHPIMFAFAQTWLRGSHRLDPLQAKVRDSLVAYAQKYSSPPNPDKLATEADNFMAAAYLAEGESIA